MVAEGIRLDSFEVKELGYAFVETLQQLLEDLVLDRCALELNEAVLTEEFGLERQAEHPLDAQDLRPIKEDPEHLGTQSLPDRVVSHRERAHLSEVLPHDV